MSKTRNYKFNNLSELQSVSYVSNGKYLNATLWLSKPFNPFPVGITPSYSILIDADYNQNTGSYGGIDYMAQIIWNNKTNTWTYDLEEYSSIHKGRVIEKIDNYTGFYTKEPVAGNSFDLNNRDVNIPINIDKIGPLIQGKVIFSVQYDLKLNNTYYSIADYSRWVPMPSPKFIVTPSPNELTLKPGDEKQIRIQINSNITNPPFPIVKFLPEPPLQGIKVKNLSESEVPLSQSGSAAFTLSIKDNKFYIPGVSITLPIVAKILYNEKNLFFNKPTESITARSFIILKFLPAETWQEYLSTKWSTWSQNIATSAGLALSIITLWLAIQRRLKLTIITLWLAIKNLIARYSSFFK